MNEDYSVELDQHRVTHAPTGCVFSFPEKVRATALDIWQVVGVGKRVKYGPETNEIRQRAFELYVEAKMKAERR